MRISLYLSFVLIAGAAAAADHFVPTGAKIERSGYATIENAPSVHYPDQPAAEENRPQGEAEWYARDNGISVEEARKRQGEQAAIMPQLAILQETLRQREASNFTSVRMIHRPDWAYVFYFKRDPEPTLAKYTANPRFKAAAARYTREELDALLKPWTDRFRAHNLTGGWGIDDTFGTAEVMMNVTEEEYRAIGKREGWSDPPDAIKLSFASPLPYLSVEERARPFVRVFAQESRATVIQLLAAGTGRITLLDGCLRVGAGPKAPLAYFHRETALGIDDQGYLALKDRATGKSKGRIGEWFTWGGPNGIDEKNASVAELRARCGNGPILNVGNPESTAQFRVRAWVIDDLARRKRISRERAWKLLRSCWARQDSAHPDRPPSDHCNL